MGSDIAETATIGIAGAGVIGASWATCFLAHGFAVRSWDPLDEDGEYIQAFVARSIDDVPGCWPEGERGTLTVHPDIATMEMGCDMIIENAPERLETKVDLLAHIDRVAGPHVIIASSTSSLLLSDISRDCEHKERVVISHPFNPPHMLPLVEMFGIDQHHVDHAARLFRGAGKHPVVMKKEMTGHITNRLTSALFREALYILEQGVATAEDIDACIANGPGVRWALMGPFMSYHLSGGPGGIAHYLKHLGPSQVHRWKDHGTPDMTDEFVAHVIDEVMQSTDGRSVDEIAAWRDAGLKGVLDVKQNLKYADED
ncbi:MAG: 3-hydroxyacyl-CoA dehydrogenase [Rhodospirillales bacterium]|jgi:carnitine 3-dehydrogenase|nr:3-hydroxyacyl-CoA dehydrogenase [Rhodospirillales bacterium]